MKTCQVQAREDRSGGKQIPCDEPAVFKVKYRPFKTNNSDYYQHPAHITYICFKHGEMAVELVKVDRKVD